MKANKLVKDTIGKTKIVLMPRSGMICGYGFLYNPKKYIVNVTM